MTVRPRLALLLGLALCSCAGPPKQEYVLGPPTEHTATLAAATATAPIQLERVQLPDYLDNRDIVSRSGNRVVSSETGRWAERLSIGIGRALAASLESRLGRPVVTSDQSINVPIERILIDVVEFEATAEHHVVLAVRWTITDSDGANASQPHQATFVHPVAAAGGDAAIVSAMSDSVAELAMRIAAGLEPPTLSVRLPRPATRTVSATQVQ
jgi:uncharacterized protein